MPAETIRGDELDGDAENGDAENGDAENGDAGDGDAGDAGDGDAENGDMLNGETGDNTSGNGDLPDVALPQGELQDDEQLESGVAATDLDTHGISLETLSDAYAAVLGKGIDPYEPEAGDGESSAGPPAVEVELPDLDRDEDEEDACEVGPRSILEAMLFVGHPENEPITATQVAALMRGVRVREIQDLCDELNEIYDRQGCPYQIVSIDSGYKMALRPEFARLRDKFYGRIKEAKLSQTAIEVLAIVAYNQPIARQTVDRMRGKPSSGLLNQLVRRELLRIERPENSRRNVIYHTTDRFLRIFGLETAEDLPQSHEVSREL